MRKYTSEYEGESNINMNQYNSGFENLLLTIKQRVSRVKMTSRHALKFIRMELDNMVKDGLYTESYAAQRYEEIETDFKQRFNMFY